MCLFGLFTSDAGFPSLFAILFYPNLSRPATIPWKSNSSPSPFPSMYARDALQGEHF
jgi:hypothetical protein